MLSLRKYMEQSGSSISKPVAPAPLDENARPVKCLRDIEGKTPNGETNKFIRGKVYYAAKQEKEPDTMLLYFMESKTDKYSAVKVPYEIFPDFFQKVTINTAA